MDLQLILRHGLACKNVNLRINTMPYGRSGLIFAKRLFTILSASYYD